MKYLINQSIIQILKANKLFKIKNLFTLNFIIIKRNKRSDIDSRLMELQAKIDLVKAFQNMPAGHGKFDFDKM